MGSINPWHRHSRRRQIIILEFRIILVINKINNMGREIRRVPPGWEHPKETDPDDRRGMGYHPMHGENYEQALKEWVDNHNLWVDGEHPDQQEAGSNVKYYAEWEGNPH